MSRSSVSTSGAWIGFLWGGVIGAVAGAITYRVYSLSIRQQVAEYFAGEKSDEDLNYVVAKIYGHPLPNNPKENALAIRPKVAP